MQIRFRHVVLLLAFCSACHGFVMAQEEAAGKPLSPMEIPQQLAGLTSQEFSKLVERARQSVVVVAFQGRDGERLGLGSGFLIDETGLIATNLHVIGEARPISVKLFDGREFNVVEIHATDKTQDLAVIRIQAEGLQPLELGAAESLSQGQPIFALGNPQGLEHSVVTGIVSGFRDGDDGMSLIQLAIPIERGNSGGPLLDMQGRVHGLLTLKSQVTDNLGYAVKASALKDLLDSPNPIPMSRWLTIGTLNQKLWEAAADVRWRQRAGHILVEGTGKGFGGRSLCLWRQSPPDVPFEVAVDVKIQEADGAAGLVFHSDGGDLHYGFYPSSGGLRLSRFDGPTVYSWNVLSETRSAAFHPKEWNRLKVRIEENRFLCYCNEELIFESSDRRFTSGRVGLAKFRHTTAEFKRFQLAEEIPREVPDQRVLVRVEELSRSIAPETPPNSALLEDYADLDGVGRMSLRRQADILEERAQRLRQLARELHERQIRERLVQVLQPEKEEPVDLLEGALLLAAMDNDELHIEDYQALVEHLAEEFRQSVAAEATTTEKLEAFHRFLFEEQGFHGSRTQYYDASNSYLNEVIDDREGLPITLSVLYMELARRVGLKAEGVGLPGHFIVRVHLDDGQSRLVDVFERGQELTEAACRQRVGEITGLKWNDAYLDPQPAEAIIVRMLRNLNRVANGAQDWEAGLRYTRAILAIEPDSAEDRMVRAVICYNTRRRDEGLADVDWILEHQPEGIVLPRVEQLRQSLLALPTPEERD